MRAIMLSEFLYPLDDAEFCEHFRRVPEAGRRLFLWRLEQLAIEQEFWADNDLSRNQMQKKTAESRQRPVGPLSELEQRAIREALEDGHISATTITVAANLALDAYFERATA
jgi:hypothetical protein